MEAIKSLISNYQADADIVGDDGQTYLFVQFKAKKLEHGLRLNAISELENSFLRINFRFAMLVDLEKIEIFKVSDDSNIRAEILLKRADILSHIEAKISLESDDILSHYDPEFSKKRIFDFHLQTLVKSWLRDLAYHWKSETPPASRELTEIGLLQLLEGGQVVVITQANLDADTLR
ncbi:hypothetical protein Cylst_5125 [Cylindrospermum stagnale PCC 7417]|uniref:Uncharacterized protein n=1 Tax=Cylindrospermum stagnale PCC 7417 TaxID=56107 RepID=K9X3E9_9NOST|nr:hypothetical protein [Cylindrospermum stagnale]AFZ27170.1 hypothetical protein Cylst_5125 [Cylindrospermum stagnale PCC 7417]